MLDCEALFQVVETILTLLFPLKFGVFPCEGNNGLRYHREFWN